MNHQDCIELLRCLPASGIRDEAIDRLERYRALLDRAHPYLRFYPTDLGHAERLRAEIVEVIK